MVSPFSKGPSVRGVSFNDGTTQTALDPPGGGPVRTLVPTQVLVPTELADGLETIPDRTRRFEVKAYVEHLTHAVLLGRLKRTTAPAQVSQDGMNV